MINLILPEEPSEILSNMINKTLEFKEYRIIEKKEDLINLKNKKLVFAIELPRSGISSNLNDIFLELFNYSNPLENSEAIILIHSDSLLNTKSYCQHIIYSANSLGCSFIGRPIIEASKDLINIEPLKRAGNKNKSLEEILLDQCSQLAKRFFSDLKKIKLRKANLLVVHSTNKSRSNTYALWKKVQASLSDDITINEISLWDTCVNDCIGCDYTICKSKGMDESCIYRDIISEEVYPSLIKANGLLIISPNYNDMLSANIIAMINRFTAIFRKYKFYDKKIFSIVVSGHSGIEALIKQIISSVNINKTFKLPANFSLYAQASEAGSIHQFEDVDRLAKDFAKRIEKELKII